MAWTALDLGLRGAAAGVLLMVCALLAWACPFRTVTMLRVGLGASGAAYAISTAPFFPAGSFGWNSPIVILYAGSPVTFWLWARAVFNDDVALRPWHLAIWTFVAGLGLFACCGWRTSPTLAATSGQALALASILFAVLAAVQTQTIWRADLVAGRRRLLIAFHLAMAVFIVLNAAAGLAAIPWRSLSFSYSLGIGMLALLGVWATFQALINRPALLAAGAANGAPGHAAAARADVVAPDQVALRRLNYLMTVERTYRQEGLSIGVLAVRLGLPEHRLRALINGGLGYRNFNAFLNRYRLDEAKAALSDPAQADVPVLTIALDAGFQSVTPFNRAFKADTGLTPTEFRRMAAGEPPAGGHAPEIDQPNIDQPGVGRPN